MPEMDGFALAEAVRAMPSAAAVPIIALATMVSAETVERGRAVGFHDFVAKFDRAGLVAAIKEQSADLDRAA
jgi:two-component system, chemotaxis family, sensor kinase CheA